MTRPTLLAELEQFLYTHMPNTPFKRELRMIVAKWEEAYIQRIEELEKVDNAGNRMENEGGPTRKHPHSRYDEDEFDHEPFDHLDGGFPDDLE